MRKLPHVTLPPSAQTCVFEEIGQARDVWFLATVTSEGDVPDVTVQGGGI
jgi:hypothetical protein